MSLKNLVVFASAAAIFLSLAAFPLAYYGVPILPHACVSSTAALATKT